jgi:hypothetical protein
MDSILIDLSIKISYYLKLWQKYKYTPQYNKSYFNFLQKKNYFSLQSFYNILISSSKIIN